MRVGRPCVAALAALTILVSVAPAARAAGGDPLFAQQYGPQQINAPAAWATSTGRDVVIAVVDTGVDRQHPELAGKLVAGIDLVDGDGAPDDCPASEQEPACGHGTHVAGIAAAATGNGQGIAGVAPGARIMPVRVLGRDGAGRVEDVTAGIRWAVDHGAKVVNLSLSGQVTLLDALIGNSLETAIDYAWSKGAVVVAAAGNLVAAGAGQPSGYSRGVKAIVVTATDRERRHPTYANRADTNWAVAAPGDDVLSTLPGNKYGRASGTSMSAPHVAGVAALLVAKGLNNQQAVERILATARPLGARSSDGAGLVDAAAAVGAPAAPAPAPAAPAPTSAPAPAAPGTPSRSAPAPVLDLPAPPSLSSPSTLPMSLPFAAGMTTVPYVPPQPAPELVPLGEFAAPPSDEGSPAPRGGAIGFAAVLLGLTLLAFNRLWRLLR